MTNDAVLVARAARGAREPGAAPALRAPSVTARARALARCALPALTLALVAACGTRATSADSADPGAIASVARSDAAAPAATASTTASAASTASAATSAGASRSGAPASASASGAPTSASGAPASAEPAAIPCTTDDECWVDDANKPVARPKAKRGVKLRPCKDTEHVPACTAGACVVRHLKC